MIGWWDSLETLRPLVVWLRWGTAIATVLSAFAAVSLVAVTNRIERLTLVRQEPRHLSKNQAAAIAAVARDRPPTLLELNFDITGPEAQSYALEIGRAFEAGGWQTQLVPQFGFSGPIPTLLTVIGVPERREGDDVLAALTAAEPSAPSRRPRMLRSRSRFSSVRNREPIMRSTAP
jgi:hypothetical protein